MIARLVRMDRVKPFYITRNDIATFSHVLEVVMLYPAFYIILDSGAKSILKKRE